MTTISVKDRRYPSFMRLVSLGRAAKGRFMYEPDGTKVIEFLPVSKTRRNPVASFGKDERKYQRAFKHYGEGFWRIAWWREAVQNAVDAKATRVDLKVERKDGYMLVSAEDNGTGMTLDVLQQKFLSEGATSKGYGESGGFGVAKELLLMPWMEWYVESNGHWAKGFREEPYEYDVLKTPRQGTLLSVKMSDKDGEHTDIEQAISYIKKCYCPNIDFYCNGIKVPADLKPGVEKNSKVIGHAGVSLSYNKKGESGIFIRDRNNLFMFKYEQEGEGDIQGAIIVTVTGNTKELLSDNRMSFGDYSLSRNFQKFVKKLTVDTKSALEPPKEQIKISLHEGKGKVISEVRYLQSDLQEKIARKFQEKRVSSTDIKDMVDKMKQLKDLMKQEVNTVASADMVKVIMALATDKDAGESVSEAAACQLGHCPDLLVYNQCQDEVSLPSILLPGPNMGPKVKKLLRFWTECCRVILIRLGISAPFGVGWCVVKEREDVEYYAGARWCYNIETSDGKTAEGHWLLLNPYKHGLIPKDGGKHVFYSLREDRDLHYLYALALHECTHMCSQQGWHSETYTSKFTDIIARNVPTSHLLKMIRDAVTKRVPGEKDDDDEVKPVEKARDLNDMAESMRTTFNNMNQDYVSGQAIEVKKALEDACDDYMQSATEKWLNRLAIAPKYSSWPNHIRQIVKHYSERHVDVRTIFLKMLETVPEEIIKRLTFSEMALLFAYEAFQVI